MYISKSFKEYITESKKSDDYEIFVANKINTLFKSKGLNAERPKVGTQYSDIKLSYNNINTWLEVKMNHKDNLSNPRVFFDGYKWDTTYKTPTAKYAIDILNKSAFTKQFIDTVKEYSGQSTIKIPTTKSGLKDPNAISLDMMKEIFKNKIWDNRYIAIEDNVDIGKLITQHYTEGKAEPAYYMQAANDFYLISKKDPFNLNKNVKKKIPEIKGIGSFKVRISTRSQFYEVQAEIKILDMNESPYNAISDGDDNPFLYLD